MTTASPFIRPATDESDASRADHTLQRLLTAASVGRSAGLIGWVELHLRPLDARARRQLDRRMTQRFMAVVAGLWEKGWQPADLFHVAGRSDRRVTELAAAVISEQGRRIRSTDRAPDAWLAQLQTLGAGRPAGPEAWSVAAQQVAAGWTELEAWTNIVVLAGCLEFLPRMQLLMPPPSAWPSARPSSLRPARPAAHQEGLVRKIRALLAKAEATEYAAEAEAFTAKAQDLMSRHAIDAALLDSAAAPDIDVTGRRIHFDAPYVLEKAQLLTAVAEANRAQVVTFAHLGLAVVVGTPVDVDQIEMLFTSVLIQATRAMSEAGSPGRNRSSPFRRSFLIAYAIRIRERLTEADDAVRASYGSELVPVLAQQSQAVTAEFKRMFPHVRSRTVTSVDLAGWEAGRDAADRAVFIAGRVSPG